MKLKTGIFKLLLITILICSGCDLVPTDSTQSINPPGQTDLPQQSSIEDADQIEVKHEENDWSSIWIENADQSEKPRILFVGDSITDGYYTKVKENLSSEYYLGYYVTSKFLGNPDFQTELTTILDRYEFEIIQINNGLHGWDYSIAEYEKGLEDLIMIVEDHAPDALFIWCLSTPVRVKDYPEYLDKTNQEVILRNQSALEIMGEKGILINDLYTEMIGRPEYYKNDGIHFKSAGKEALAELVVEFILSSR